MDEWTPEPLVAPQTSFEEAESEKLPVIVGYVCREDNSALSFNMRTVLQVRESSFPAAGL